MFTTAGDFSVTGACAKVVMRRSRFQYQAPAAAPATSTSARRARRTFFTSVSFVVVVVIRRIVWGLARIEPALEDELGGHLIDDLAPLRARHVRLQQRARRRHGGQPLVPELHGQPE